MVDLYLGDCLDIMPTLEANSVDSIITDPPGGIAFMGKLWDNLADHKPRTERGRQVWLMLEGMICLGYLQRWEAGFLFFTVDWATQALRAAKPGAPALVWAIPRTSDLTKFGLRLAGWEIRDTVYHLFGSGFPKSMDISKAIDKLNGRMMESRLELARHIKDAREQSGHTRAELNEWCDGALLAEHWESTSSEFVRVPRLEHWEILKRRLPLSDEFDWLIERIEAEREVIGHNNRPPGWFTNGDGHDITSPATDAAALWSGWGTALKPAAEEWILAMKPRDGTFAENALAYGCAGLWIDGCRIGTNGEQVQITAGHASAWYQGGNCSDGYELGTGRQYRAGGRWPANLLLSHTPECRQVGVRKVKGNGAFPKDLSGSSLFGLDGHSNGERIEMASPDGTETIGDWRCVEGCPARLLDEQSGERASHDGADNGGTRKHKTSYNCYGEYALGTLPPGRGDTGGASRFFTRFHYSAKASRSERESGLLGHIPCLKCGELDSVTHINPKTGKEEKCRRNGHPTVKPLDLMRWLCRLTATPTGGVVLDPFMGSGRTGKACVLEGRDFIGIELERASFDIAEAAIEAAQAEMVQAEYTL